MFWGTKKLIIHATCKCQDAALSINWMKYSAESLREYNTYMVSSQDWVQSCTALSTTDSSIILEDTVTKQKHRTQSENALMDNRRTNSVTHTADSALIPQLYDKHVSHLITRWVATVDIYNCSFSKLGHNVVFLTSRLKISAIVKILMHDVNAHWGTEFFNFSN